MRSRLEAYFRFAEHQTQWRTEILAGFTTFITMALSYSIAIGLSFGLVSFAVLELATGGFRRQHWMLYLLAVLFLVRFIYPGPL